MSDEDREEELRRALKDEGGEEEPERKSVWNTKKNWGMWVLFGAFVLYLIWHFVIMPRYGG